jgi:16S rRNA (guanine966-N2)-methyltransferase
VVKVLPTLKGQQFDRIYFDPPYKGELYEVVLAAIVEFDLLAEGGEIAAEHAPGRSIVCEGFVVCREKKYGNTAVTFFEQETQPNVRKGS